MTSSSISSESNIDMTSSSSWSSENLDLCCTNDFCDANELNVSNSNIYWAFAMIKSFGMTPTIANVQGFYNSQTGVIPVTVLRLPVSDCGDMNSSKNLDIINNNIYWTHAMLKSFGMTPSVNNMQGFYNSQTGLIPTVIRREPNLLPEGCGDSSSDSSLSDDSSSSEILIDSSSYLMYNSSSEALINSQDSVGSESSESVLYTSSTSYSSSEVECNDINMTLYDRDNNIIDTLVANPVCDPCDNNIVREILFTDSDISVDMIYQIAFTSLHLSPDCGLSFVLTGLNEAGMTITIPFAYNTISNRWLASQFKLIKKITKIEAILCCTDQSSSSSSSLINIYQ